MPVAPYLRTPLTRIRTAIRTAKPGGDQPSSHQFTRPPPRLYGFRRLRLDKLRGLGVPRDVPAEQHPAYDRTPTASHCSKGYPCFYPAGFAIDIVVPIVNVHQADDWAVNGYASWGWVWVGGTWVATGLGWALATLFVAGYTGLVRSD